MPDDEHCSPQRGNGQGCGAVNGNGHEREQQAGIALGLGAARRQGNGHEHNAASHAVANAVDAIGVGGKGCDEEEHGQPRVVGEQAPAAQQHEAVVEEVGEEEKHVHVAAARDKGKHDARPQPLAARACRRWRGIAILHEVEGVRVHVGVAKVALVGPQAHEKDDDDGDDDGGHWQRGLAVEQGVARRRGQAKGRDEAKHEHRVVENSAIGRTRNGAKEVKYALDHNLNIEKCISLARRCRACTPCRAHRRGWGRSGWPQSRRSPA